MSWSWFKFNNLALAVSMALKFYTSVAKVLKVNLEIVAGYNSYVYMSYRVKTVKGEYLSVLSPNAEKYGPEKTLYLDTFHAVVRMKSLVLLPLFSYFQVL